MTQGRADSDIDMSEREGPLSADDLEGSEMLFGDAVIEVLHGATEKSRRNSEK